MKIFVCYTMRDGEITPSHLRRVERILKTEGHSVFIDYLNNDSVHKQQRVVSELKSSDEVILLVSPKVKDSEWVSIELAYAKQNHIQVIPYKLSNNILIKQDYS